MNLDLTVRLTQSAVITSTLASGRVLTLRIASLPHGVRYLMEGSPTGSHDLAVEASVTPPERLQAHWTGYIQAARGTLDEMNAVRKQRVEAEMRRASRQLTAQAEQLALILKGPKEAGLRGPGGITVSLRACEVFPDDPGEGTPAMVNVPFKGSSTYWCCLDMGIVTTDRADHELSPAQQEWLASEFVDEAVNGFVAVWTKRIEANPKLRPSRKNTH